MRNIGFDTDQPKFEEYMRRFGDIHYAVLCMQTENGEKLDVHKGSGFVKFKNRADAMQLLELSKNVESHLDKERKTHRLQ